MARGNTLIFCERFTFFVQFNLTLFKMDDDSGILPFNVKSKYWIVKFKIIRNHVALAVFSTPDLSVHVEL